MAYNVLELVGNIPQKTVLNKAGVLGWGTIVEPLYNKFNKLKIAIRYTSLEVYTGPGHIITHNDVKSVVVLSNGTFLVESTLGETAMFEAIVKALIHLMTLLVPGYKPPLPPGPKPPSPKPVPGDDTYDIYADTAYFAAEGGSVYHKIHTGLEPGLFYATPAQAQSDNLTPCGVCNPI